MGKSSRENPSPSDEVRIDVPYGYPLPPTADDTTTTNSPEDGRRKKLIIYCGCGLIFSLVFATLAIYLEPENKLPRFQLDSVSVNVDSNSTAAVWDIGYSIDTTFRDLTVWVRFMGRDYKVETAGTAGNTTVSVRTLFDYSGGGRLTLDQVMFRCNNYDDYYLKAACTDINVFSTTSEGPRLCPIVEHQLIT